jgi:hypothetical protein
MRKQGETRVTHICRGCGRELLEIWQDINGGYWLPERHGHIECNTELLRLIRELQENKR